MQTEIIISGFGGQGVLFGGQILAHAAVRSGKEVTWFPSYGPEMRGGTASCTVIISEEEIGSPTVRNPQAAILLNLPSLDKYEDQVRTGGILVVNASLVNREVLRRDVDVIEIPANEIAEGIGDKRLTNMVLLGALLERLPVLSVDSIKQALRENLPARKRNLLDQNLEALDKGFELAHIRDVITII